MAVRTGFLAIKVNLNTAFRVRSLKLRYRVGIGSGPL
jgi:hypothetical protein